MSIGMWVLLVLWCGVIVDIIRFQRKQNKRHRRLEKELADLRGRQTLQLERDLWLIADVQVLKKRANENHPKYSQVLNDLFVILEKYGEKGKSHGSPDA